MFAISLFTWLFFCSSRRRHTRCALVTGVQTCALPICGEAEQRIAGGADAVSVIGERALRHPFDARRDVQRVGAEAHFGAVDVARADRQAVVAELDVAADTEVTVGLDLSPTERWAGPLVGEVGAGSVK